MNTTAEGFIVQYNSNQISYESDFNSYSNLSGNCVTVTSVIEDIYNQLEETYIDFNENDFLSEDGYITYPTDLNFYKTVKQHKEEIKSLIDEVEELKTGKLCNMSITGCDIDLQGLVDNCNNPPETFEDLINIIIQNLTNE